MVQATAWLINFLKNKDEDWATAKAPCHRQLHRYNYETWITRNLADKNMPKSIFMNRFKTIKLQIKAGSFPKEVLQKKDELWKGK